jgi:hypothetical protein
MKLINERIGVVFGISVLHLKPNIFYGGFVKGAYQLEYAYNTR